MELIKITTNEQGSKVVSARELYDNLGLDKSNWSKWYPKNIEKNQFAIEGTDYTILVLSTKTPDVGRPTKDFALTIDFAKRLSMMARTEEGEKIRNYFIECEKQLQVKALPSTKELALMVVKAEEEKEALAFQLEIKTQDLALANETIKEQATSVAFVEKVLQSKTTYTTNQVALGVGMTAQKLNTVLQNKGILYKQSGSWHLYGNYRNKGYAEQRTHHYYNSKNEPMTSTSLVWTESGRKFIHEQLNSNLNFAVVQTQTSATA